jgi:hypothetical protein
VQECAGGQDQIAGYLIGLVLPVIILAGFIILQAKIAVSPTIGSSGSGSISQCQHKQCTCLDCIFQSSFDMDFPIGKV